MPKSIKVKDYMAAQLVTFYPGTDILEAIQTLLEYRISGATVVDNLGNIVGILSEKDCLAVALQTSYHGQRDSTVEHFMSQDVKTVHANTSLVEVARLFLDTNHRRYPVVNDEGRLIGQISRRDVLKALQALWD